MVKVSLIILNWNAGAMTQEQLENVSELDIKGLKVECVVVDNGSSDGSQAMVKKKFPQVKLILNNQNLGFSKANNQGIKKAKGQYIFLLNSDTYLVENSFKKLLT